MTTLYYTVEKYVENDGVEDVLTGMKNISVYEIANDKPHLFVEFDATNESISESEIQEWLDNNGFENREYEFEVL